MFAGSQAGRTDHQESYSRRGGDLLFDPINNNLLNMTNQNGYSLMSTCTYEYKRMNFYPAT
ncbi:hypothetical protein [Paenibacillus sp. GM2FR]|uniref:hypothetical protein n=1 Tax=Paenibacillus sp. GM2FR TaxID=2059268 RepID=UPI0013FD3676|nr:hypothetical protein [Paenibacillus sp. GM2FR]